MKLNPINFLCSVTLAILLSACGGNMMSASMPVVANGILVGPNGMTLYTFDRDKAASGKSVCNAQCAVLWPPMLASATDVASGNFTIITRDDGAKQWAFKGEPVYYWSKDTKAGDMTGDNVNKVWHTAKP